MLRSLLARTEHKLVDTGLGTRLRRTTRMATVECHVIWLDTLTYVHSIEGLFPVTLEVDGVGQDCVESAGRHATFDCV